MARGCFWLDYIDWSIFAEVNEGESFDKNNNSRDTEQLALEIRFIGETKRQKDCS